LQGDVVTCPEQLLRQSVPSLKLILVTTSMVQVQMTGSAATDKPPLWPLGHFVTEPALWGDYFALSEATTEHSVSVHLLN